MQKLKLIKKSQEAISSVVGDVLITGIVVLALSSVLLIVNSIDRPVDSTHVSVEEWVDVPSNTIYLRHIGGEPINVEDMKIDVNVNGISYVYPQSAISNNLGKTQWELADTIEINTDSTWNLTLTNENDVVVKLVDLGSKEVLPKYRVGFSNCGPPGGPAEGSPVEFEIIGNAVVPDGDFISSFTVLGAAIQSGGYDLMVTSRLKIGNDTFDPWGDYGLAVTGNVNDGAIHTWDLSTSYPAGTAVTVGGRSWIWTNSMYRTSTDDTKWNSYMEVNSASHSSNLKVLRNGDEVPTIEGMDDQPDVADFIADYVDDTGTYIVLEENEAIFLFELGTTDLHSTSADFQDLVILMSIDHAPAS